MCPRRLSACFLLLALALALTLPSRAQAPPAPARDRGLKLDGAAQPALKEYPQKWALVVGANSTPAADAKNPKLDKLDNAEDDAKAVYDKLLGDFGFAADTTLLLLGSAEGNRKATKKNIEDYLSNVLCSDRVGPEDCVVFFFAGHGRRRKDATDANYIGEIVPEGAALDDKGFPQAAEVLDLDYLTENRLSKRCPARYKLLVLDCCHSGQIFNLPLQPAKFGRQADAEARRLNPCFWGAAACRSDQTTPDKSTRSPEHSPFTAALLRQLDVLSGNEGNVPFTAGELFASVRVSLENEGRDAQKPVAGPLTSDSGDFWLFPRPDGKPRHKPVEGILATLPGATGDWWFDKAPALIPSLRGKIVSTMQARSALLGVTDEESLVAAAESYCKAEKSNFEKSKAVGFSGNPNPMPEMRVKHLGMLLALRRAKDRNKDLAKIRDELAGRYGDGSLAAADYHLLAALEHRLAKAGASPAAAGMRQPAPEPASGERKGPAEDDEPDAVRRCYRRAVAEYEKELAKDGKDNSSVPMLALCLSDWGYYELSRAEYEEAVQKYKEAWARLKEAFKEPPPHFHVCTLCKQAEALRSMGNWDAANNRLKEARQDANFAEKDGGTLLAFALEHQAWSYITQWRVNEAKDCFEEAARLRTERLKAVPDDLDSEILLLHDRHGAAMATRFQGKSEEAVQQYKQLIKDVRQAILDFERDGDQHRDHASGLERLNERLQNSMERLADCLTFQEEPDYAEAARFLNKASGLAPLIPGDQGAVVYLQMQYKLALRRSQSADVQDRAAAVRILQEADQGLAEGLEAGRISKGQAENARLLHDVTTALVALAAPQADAGSPSEKESPVKGLLQMLKSVEAAGAGKGPAPPRDARDVLLDLIHRKLTDREQRRHLQRDDIELMMFAARVLVHDARAHAEHRSRTERHPAERSSTVLLRLCHLVQEGRRTDTLAYLRPSFDLVFAARLEAGRPDVKGLLDLMANATSGRDFDEVVLVPTLCFYFPQQGPGYALLDVPHGTSKAFPLSDDLASAKGDRRAVRLPRDLESELAKLRDVQICWRDPVHDLGDDYAALFQLSGKQYPNLKVAYVDLVPQAPKAVAAVPPTMPPAGGPGTTDK